MWSGETNSKKRHETKCAVWVQNWGAGKMKFSDEPGLGGGRKARNHCVTWSGLITTALLWAPAASFRICSHNINQGEPITEPDSEWQGLEITVSRQGGWLQPSNQRRLGLWPAARQKCAPVIVQMSCAPSFSCYQSVEQLAFCLVSFLNSRWLPMGFWKLVITSKKN